MSLPMYGINALLTLVDAYRLAHKVSDARVSTLVFNDGGRIAMLRDGKDIGTRRLERAIQWFSDNWPADAVWPTEVQRPALSEEVAA